MRVAVLPARPVTPVPRDTAAVIIDVLRATTTLTVALAHGAARVLPAVNPEEAFSMRRRFPDSLLCGERHGRKVEGFDLGNSPFEYAAEVVATRELIFASTNGSGAMRRAAGARRRVLAAFVNVTAVFEALKGEPHVTLICSGKNGFAMEDMACAAWLCRRWVEAGAEPAGPAARLALAMAPSDAVEAGELVRGSAHASELFAMGASYARDVQFCAELDTIGRAFEL